MPREKIRNFGKFLGVYLISLVIAAIGVFALTSCDGWPSSSSNNYDTADSVMVAQQVEAIVNPQFTSVQELIQFRQQTNEGFTIDSIFRAIPEQVIKNVATVILNKQKTVTKKSLVEEYRANKSVYDNLPTANNLPAKPTQDVNLDDGDRHLISTTYSYRTDTIDGEPRKIQIKKEESYVRE